MPSKKVEWQEPLQVDVTQPSIARVYDYLLGGKDNFAADREVGERIRQALPAVRIGVEQQRALLRRVVRYLVGEVGLRQLIDIGSGLPTAHNVDEVAHEIDPGVRVVYVDNDPVVLAHARALLADNAETIVIDGDLRRPDEILGNTELVAHLDLSQPVGLILCGILHHIKDEEDPAGVTRTMSSRLVSGSHVFIHHLAYTGEPQAVLLRNEMQSLGSGHFRTVDAVTTMFDGLEIIDPGIVYVTDWRPDFDTPSSSHPIVRLAVAGVGRKP